MDEKHCGVINEGRTLGHGCGMPPMTEYPDYPKENMNLEKIKRLNIII